MRSSRVVRDQVSNARRAALTARSTSSALPIEIRPIGCSVAGLITTRVAGFAGGTQAPSI